MKLRPVLASLVKENSSHCSNPWFTLLKITLISIYNDFLSVNVVPLPSFVGSDLAERFRDQFHPMHVTQETSLDSSNSTVIRMPLSTKCLKESEKDDCKRVRQIFDRFMKHSSSTLLLLKSVFQVTFIQYNASSFL